jgi:hypothetical protein
MSDIQSLKTLIGNISPGDLSSLIDIFSYQGFSPEMVFKHLLGIKTAKSIGDGTFSDDIKSMVCLGVISGNYTNKNREKRDEKGVTLADGLFAKYDLHMGSLGEKKKAVTLPRILLSFPVLTSRISLLCPEKNFSGPFDSSTLPHAMKTVVFPSLIPKSLGAEVRKMMLIVYCCYSCDQTFAINQSTKSLSPKEVFNMQYPFVEISFNSSEPNESDRESYFKTLSVKAAAMNSVISKYKELINPSYQPPSAEK